MYTFGEIKVHESMEQLGQGCDILVATMGRLNQFVREEKVNKKGKQKTHWKILI
jgi:superfamily II DNA/RNA helicase